jgi:hypothetical protein
MRTYGSKHHFGGHASEKLRLPEGVEITSIEVNPRDGVRMHLSNGTSAGELNTRHHSEIVKLTPSPNEFIVGFFGKSERGGGFCGVEEFGIITVQRDVGIAGLPESVWDMDELKNTSGMEGDEVREHHNLALPLIAYGRMLTWDCRTRIITTMMKMTKTKRWTTKMTNNFSLASWVFSLESFCIIVIVVSYIIMAYLASGEHHSATF